jgi:hypothetical protein
MLILWKAAIMLKKFCKATYLIQKKTRNSSIAVKTFKIIVIEEFGIEMIITGGKTQGMKLILDLKIKEDLEINPHRLLGQLRIVQMVDLELSLPQLDQVKMIQMVDLEINLHLQDQIMAQMVVVEIQETKLPETLQVIGRSFQEMGPDLTQVH